MDVSNAVAQWWRRGPIGYQMHKFMWSCAPLHYKISMLAYMCSYCALLFLPPPPVNSEADVEHEPMQTVSPPRSRSVWSTMFFSVCSSPSTASTCTASKSGSRPPSSSTGLATSASRCSSTVLANAISLTLWWRTSHGYHSCLYPSCPSRLHPFR